jgi:Flp pilus assembly protein TadG
LRSESRLRSSRAQALLELALCAPIVILLALGTVAGVEVAAARAGLDAATQAAADAAARAPDATSAVEAAHERFWTMIAGYPVEETSFSVSVGDFGRAGRVTASSSVRVDLAWAALLLLPSHMTLKSVIVVPLEPWRTHRSS